LSRQNFSETHNLKCKSASTFLVAECLEKASHLPVRFEKIKRSRSKRVESPLAIFVIERLNQSVGSQVRKDRFQSINWNAYAVGHFRNSRTFGIAFDHLKHGHVKLDSRSLGALLATAVSHLSDKPRCERESDWRLRQTGNFHRRFFDVSSF